jgi:hypothetical protein
MLDKSRKDSLYGMAGTPYRGQSSIVPRPTLNDVPGDSESLKRYRRFFETHDLRGLPQRDTQTNAATGTISRR